jgi:hypothetical protein
MKSERARRDFERMRERRRSEGREEDPDLFHGDCA